MKQFIRRLLRATNDENFMHFIENIEVIVSKVLSLFMVGVIFVAIIDLGLFLIKSIFIPDRGGFSNTLFKTFELFLDILIALEILENLTGYLKKHILQVELVIVTSLTAIARKIILLDVKATEGIEIIGLGAAILALSISYLIVRSSHPK